MTPEAPPVADASREHASTVPAASSRWGRGTLRGQILLSLGTVLAAMLVALAAVDLGNRHVVVQLDEVIARASRRVEHAEAALAALHRARRHESEFLLALHDRGYEAARVRLLPEARAAGAAVDEHLSRLQSFDRDAQLAPDIEKVREATRRYTAAFDAAATLNARLGAEHGGLEGELRRASAGIERILLAGSTSPPVLALLQLRRAEEEYLHAPSEQRLAAVSRATGLLGAARSAAGGDAARRSPDEPETAHAVDALVARYRGALDEHWATRARLNVEQEAYAAQALAVETLLRELIAQVYSGRLKRIEWAENVQLTAHVVVALVILAALLASARAVRRILRGVAQPVDQCVDLARQLADGNLGQRAQVSGFTEIAKVSEALNAMAGSLQQSLDIERSRREELAAAHRAVEVSEQRLRFLLRGSPAVIYSLDPTAAFRPTWVSENVAKQLGFAAARFVDDPAFWASRLHPDDLPRLRETQAQLVRSGRETLEYRFRHADGDYRWLQDEAVALLDASGHPHEVIGAMVDITARIGAERRLQQTLAALQLRENEILRQNDELARAAELKTHFLATVTHELRTPLNGILGFSDLLSEGSEALAPEDRAAYAREIREAGENMLHLVNDLLDLAEAMAGRAALQLAPTDLAFALASVIDAARGDAGAKSITCTLDVAPGLGEVMVDARRLQRIVEQLLSNAVKFTAHGGRVRVGVSAIEGELPASAALPDGWSGRCLQVGVSDTGVGIRAADLARLFEPFTQLDQGLQRQHGGTGMGLALARYLTELQGGVLGVQSEPGAGSTFTVRLPWRSPVAGSAPAVAVSWDEMTAPEPSRAAEPEPPARRATAEISGK